MGRAGIGTHVAQMVSINEGHRLPWIEDVCLGGADHQGNGQNCDWQKPHDVALQRKSRADLDQRRRRHTGLRWTAITRTKGQAMSVTQADLAFATKLPAMSDEELLQAWRAAVTTGVDQRITMAESAAIVRFGSAGWRQHYAARFSGQTYYLFPRKPG
jgi:hypothetical protein